jgi:AMMECR1 domain-containing protein
MLAEIYMLRLEAAARAAKEAATSSSRFVPVPLPGPKAS